MITKFSSSTNPQPVFFQQFEYTTGVFKYKVTIDNNDYILSDGDYVYTDDNNLVLQYIPASEYAGNVVTALFVREQVGRDVNRAIWAAFNSSGLSSANKGSIANTIGNVIDMMQYGEVQAGRDVANAISVSAPFTAPVKTALLNIVDAALLKL